MAAQAPVSTSSPQYSGFYPADLIPKHYLTDQTAELMPSWSELVGLEGCVAANDGSTPPTFTPGYEGLCGAVPSVNDLAQPCSCDVKYENPNPNVPNSRYECARSYVPAGGDTDGSPD